MANKFKQRRSSINTKGPNHRSSIWAGAFSIFILLVFIGLRTVGDNLYLFPENPPLPSIPKDTAIICLAGAKGRIEEAFSLYAKGVGNSLYIIGAGKRSSIQTLVKNHAAQSAELISEPRLQQVRVETESRNTIENAAVVDRILQARPELQSFVLVTSGYHMRRAQFMIENQSHRKVQIIPYVPEKESIGRFNWWTTWLGIQITLMEYLKYLMAVILVPKL